TITGNDGDDVLIGAAGADILDGGNGFDTASYAGALAAVSVNLLTGFGTAGDAAGDFYGYIEKVIGSGFNDTLTGGNNADVLDGGAGSDTMAGGLGDDTYVVERAGDQVSEALNAGTDTVQSSVAYTLGDNVENLTLTGAAPIGGFGNALNNVIIGTSANN